MITEQVISDVRLHVLPKKEIVTLDICLVMSLKLSFRSLPKYLCGIKVNKSLVSIHRPYDFLTF